MPNPRILAVIPARGGSKGIAGKNIKLLGGKPLISYTIIYAKSLFSDTDICLSTDSEEIIGMASKEGLEVPFVRPASLADDAAGSYEVIVHALDFYDQKGISYDAVALFQPTSPFRLKSHFKEALNEFDPEIDLVVSVTKTKSNPYYLLMEENKNGFLEKSKKGNFTRRQEIPEVYEINGSIYICNVESLRKYASFNDFSRIRKYVMDDIYSVDIDTMIDWNYAEFLIQRDLIAFD